MIKYTQVLYGRDICNTADTVLRRFSYNDSGRPVYMGANGTLYFYHYNAHGDVVKMTDLSGNTVAEYKYDAWGNITAATGTATTADGQLLKDANPFRYSGYYYDAETGMYYLKSRY